MIVSASRRTDIPAFYSEWFMNRIREGFVLVRNPFNPQQVSRISLKPGDIDCIVFWTKNPANILGRLEELDRRGYHYYFLFTLTPYGKDIETNLPDKEEIVSTFIRLSSMIGRQRVIWRYDPVVITGQLDRAYHEREFRALARKLAPCTDRCIISFLDFYAKTKRNMKDIPAMEIEEASMRELSRSFRDTCRQYDLQLQTCAEEIDLADMGIPAGKCIDDERIAAMLGRKISVPKAPGQRKTCRCASSVDIGAYNSCPHHCLYCYANYSRDQVKSNIALHDPESPFLIGQDRDENQYDSMQENAS
ncbi:MAG TPA: DUF1848 domain-containing protein [Nitrospirota bacterium]|nr:DUF1848 domain-containing protein [Nitrospirota bacterium]